MRARARLPWVSPSLPMLRGQPRRDLAFCEADGPAIQLEAGQLPALEPVEDCRRADVEELGDITRAEQRRGDVDGCSRYDLDRRGRMTFAGAASRAALAVCGRVHMTVH